MAKCKLKSRVDEMRKRTQVAESMEMDGPCFNICSQLSNALSQEQAAWNMLQNASAAHSAAVANVEYWNTQAEENNCDC